MAKLQKFGEGWKVVEPIDGESVVLGTIIPYVGLTSSGDGGFTFRPDTDLGAGEYSAFDLREIADLMDEVAAKATAAVAGE
jgi:hypothetical protein